MAACPVIFALLILIVVGHRAGVARLLAMAVAAVLCVLGVENKNFEYNTANVIAVVNPLEKILGFTDANTADALLRTQRHFFRG